MESVKVMVDEHQNILRMLKVIRTACFKVYQHEKFDYDKFYDMIDFVRNYADKHHHSKEEEILFKEMEKQIPRAKEPIQGMFIDHDSGRHYIRNLESALEKVKNGDDEAHIDIISNALAYVELLTRHIDKEDNVIYKFAEKHLNDPAKDLVEKACEKIEDEANDKGIQEKYLNLLVELEKYFNVK
ncbi:hemerythrin [Vulcanibacillus modesticaldus]|uniref:Hemerythrin n=1 Tax=Vulcanibacillus modesticaldus TaxID=337097 RepID=A0A1D2YW31_9BACI|nr:hemerythrin domain-containing protein [Vulcanibacillus modesticaldus]OEF99948.1 hemerythrin [Vulcanibacillus modesticaldus]